MNIQANKLGELLTRRRTVPRTREELEQWMDGYRESVGSTADGCVTLLQDLYGVGALDEKATDQVMELLETLDALSADPITISCAIIHVAGLEGPDISETENELPAPVRRQLDDLRKMKHYESGQPLAARNAVPRDCVAFCSPWLKTCAWY